MSDTPGTPSRPGGDDEDAAGSEPPAEENGGLRASLAALVFGRWATWLLVLVLVCALLVLLAAIYVLGSGDMSAAGPGVVSLLVAVLSGTIVSQRRRAGRPARDGGSAGSTTRTPDPATRARWKDYATDPDHLDRPRGKEPTGPFGDPADVPPWAERFAATGDRVFPLSQPDLVDALRAALHDSPHFVLSEVHLGGATVHRRTQRAYLGERILLSFTPAEGGTRVTATFRPLSAASVGTASGSLEIERLFRVIEERLGGADRDSV